MLDKELTFSTLDGERAGTTILKIDGPFTLGNMFQLQAEMRKLTPACLIMDMTGVPYMDSAGLGVIMNYYVAAQNQGRKFYLVGVNERVHALLEMTKVDSLLRIFDTVDAAEAQA